MSNDYMIQSFLDSNIIIPSGSQVWNEKALLVTDETGVFIWEKLAGDIQYNELLQDFKIYFQWNDEDVYKRVNIFLSLLRERGLLLEGDNEKTEL